MILAGDVGGTKVHLALYAFEGGFLKSVRDQRFPAYQFPSLEAVVEQFLTGDATAEVDKTERDQIVAACFGVPGPVRHGRHPGRRPAASAGGDSQATGEAVRGRRRRLRRA